MSAPIGADVLGAQPIGILRDFDDDYGRHSHNGAQRPVDAVRFVDVDDWLAITVGYVGRHREQLDTWYRHIHKASDTGAMVRILDTRKQWSGNLALVDAPAPYWPTELAGA